MKQKMQQSLPNQREKAGGFVVTHGEPLPTEIVDAALASLEDAPVTYFLDDGEFDPQSFAAWWRHMGKPEIVRFERVSGEGR
jgi:hypothetical protein